MSRTSLRVIPAAHFSWVSDDFESLGGSLLSSEATASLHALESPRTMKAQETLGFGNTAGKPRKKQRKRDTRCARCAYVTGRIMSEHGRKIQIPALILFGAVQVVLFGCMWTLVWRYEGGGGSCCGDPRSEDKVSPFIEGFWVAWSFMADGGTHAKAYHAEQRFLGGIITVFGIIDWAMVLAFIVDMVREKMGRMRAGKGQVHENNHIVILHWTDTIIPLIQELCIASESDGGGVLVVLAKESMEFMSHELMTKIPKSTRRGTKIVCRHGNPAVVVDLIKVDVPRAKAVVILASGRNADESDSSTLRCLLSIQSMGQKLRGHIVAEVRDVDNEALLQLAGGKLIETFVSHDVLGRLMLMSVRQIGLANVYDSMLGFEGNEFYMKAWPELNGLPWESVLERFPKAIPIGLRRADGVHLNPGNDVVINEGDQLIVIAEEPRSYRPEPPSRVEAGRIPRASIYELRPEKVLICGWRRDIRDILKLLNCVVAEGTEVHTMTHSVLVKDRNQQLLDEGLNVNDLLNIKLVHQWGSTSSRKMLEHLPLEHYTSCLIFADQSYEEDTMQADSHTLATLVLIRDIQGKRKKIVNCPVTCEVLDSSTQRTISGNKQASRMSDFVQSNKFVARILAMTAENRSVRLILSELLGASGASLLIVPSSWYTHDNEHISFWSVAKRASALGAVLIGYQEKTIGSQKRTTLNPPDKFKSITWSRYDLAIIATNLTLKDRHGSTTAEAGEAVNAMQGARERDETSNSTSHETIDIFTDEDFLVPEEGGVCASADTASSAMVRMATRCCQSMNEQDRLQFGTWLGTLGQSVKNGAFPALGASASEESRAMNYTLRS